MVVSGAKIYNKLCRDNRSRPLDETCYLPTATTTARAAATTRSSTTRNGRTSIRSWTRLCGWTGLCGRTGGASSTVSSGIMIGTTDTRRIAMTNRPRTMTTRRRRRRTPGVHDNRILHHDRIRLFGRFDSRPVTMRADGRPIGMCNNLHAVADRADWTVDVTPVDPCAGRRTASH